MDSLYSIGVRLSLETAGFGSAASLATVALQKLEQQSIAATGSVGALHKSLGLLAAGTVVTGIGVALADGLDKAAKKGAELQTVMAGIGMATGATHAQMAKLSSSFVAIGLKNQMSSTDVANIALSATHAGITDTKQLMGSIGTLANFAEVQQLSTHVSREEATKTGAEYAHIFGAYTPQLLNPLVNVLSKALTHTPLSGAGFEALVSQFGGMTASLYGRSTAAKLASQKDDTMMGVLLGQMGQGTRGGTQFGSGLIHLATATAGTAAGRARATLEQYGGGQFFNQDGSFRGDKNLLTILTRAADALSPGQMTKLNKDAFGLVGMKLFGNLEQQARLDQWNTNAATFARIPGLDKQQSVYNATAEGQSQQWHKNVETMVTIFGTALLPTLLKVSNAMVGITRTVVEFMNTHRGLVDFAAGFGLVATGVALIVGPILMATGAVGLLALAFGTTLGAVLLPVIGIIAAVGAVIAAGVLIWQHWSDITKALGVIFGGVLGPALSAWGDMLGPIVSAVGGAISAFLKWSDAGQQLGNLFSWMGGKLHDFLVLLGLLHNGPPHATNAGLTPAEARAQARASLQPRTAEGSTIGLKPDYSSVHLTHPPTPVHPVHAPKPGKGGGGVGDIHFHEGAIVVHGATVEKGKQIGQEIAQGFREGLAREGTGAASTLYPSLH